MRGKTALIECEMEENKEKVSKGSEEWKIYNEINNVW